MKKLMLATSTLAMLAVAPAMAQNLDADANASVQTEAEVNANERWEDTKDATSQAWESTKEAVTDTAGVIAEGLESAYYETAEWLDTNTDIDTYVGNETRISASDISGMDIYNTQNVKIGDVSDLVLDANGNIEQVVVTSGGLFGIGGEKSVLSYDQVSMQTEGKVGFSTDLTKAELTSGEKFDETTLGNDMYLASNLVGSAVVNSDMQEVAEIDNIVFENGEADKLVVSYEEKGGNNERGLIDFDDARVMMDANQRTAFKVSD